MTASPAISPSFVSSFAGVTSPWVERETGLPAVANTLRSNPLLATNALPTNLTPSDAMPVFMQGAHLPSPIEAERHGQHLVPIDQPLRANLFAKGLLNTYENTVQLANDTTKSLKGKSGVSELMAMGKIPYVLGGATLCATYLAGGKASPKFANALVALGLYMGSWFFSDKWVKALYRANTGVDLGTLFQSKTGRILPMFGSVAFPRVDITPSRAYTNFAKRLGLSYPESQPTHNSLQPLLKSMNTEARLLGLLLAFTHSTIGVGYIAQQPGWQQWASAVGKAFQTNKGLSRFTTTAENALSHLSLPLKQALLPPAAGALRTQWLAYGASAAAVVAAHTLVLANALTFKQRHLPQQKSLPPTLPSVVETRTALHHYPVPASLFQKPATVASSQRSPQSPTPPNALSGSTLSTALPPATSSSLPAARPLLRDSSLLGHATANATAAPQQQAEEALLSALWQHMQGSRPVGLASSLKRES